MTDPTTPTDLTIPPLRTVMDDFWARIRSRHVEAVERGEHDKQCEFRADGYYVCNCHARARIAAGFTEPPVLIYMDPICDRCGRPVSHDGDCFTCHTCHVHWPHNRYDEPGEFTDDHGPIDMTEWDERAKARTGVTT